MWETQASHSRQVSCLVSHLSQMWQERSLQLSKTVANAQEIETSSGEVFLGAVSAGREHQLSPLRVSLLSSS